jgi:hypothetical protein
METGFELFEKGKYAVCCHSYASSTTKNRMKKGLQVFRLLLGEDGFACCMMEKKKSQLHCILLHYEAPTRLWSLYQRS